MLIKHLENNERLAQFLGLTETDLLFLFNKKLKYYEKDLTEEQKKEGTFVYKKITIKKLSGEKREIFQVCDKRLETAQRKIQESLSKEYVPSDNVHGFVKGKSIKTNAKIHLAQKYITKLDIKNFFPSIKSDKIEKIFVDLGCNKDIAKNLCKILTIEDSLAQGFYTSPIISNIIFKDIDDKLIKLALSEKCNYSRYGDDLTFSSQISFFKIELVENILQKEGFSLNKNKIKFMRRGGNQVVTGLTVFDSDYPRIPKKTKRKLRMYMYYIKKYGMGQHFNKARYIFNKRSPNEINTLEGWLRYVNSIEPKLALKYYPIFEIEKMLEIERINEMLLAIAEDYRCQNEEL